MGVWIETPVPLFRLLLSPVTPLVGVWIETNHHVHHQNQNGVTPLVGVWIETYLGISALTSCSGHTPRGCVD